MRPGGWVVILTEVIGLAAFSRSSLCTTAGHLRYTNGGGHRHNDPGGGSCC